MKYSKIFFILLIPLIFLLLSVNNASAVNRMQKYSKAVAKWQTVPNASGYNIYYKEKSDKKYIHAVRNVPGNATSYTVSYLKRGVTYMYKVAALDGSGSEFWWSNGKWLSNYQPI